MGIQKLSKYWPLWALTNNPNDPNKYERTPIYEAARKGHTEIVKTLSPLTDYPNNPDDFGETPIYWAARNGHSEIVKILAPLTDYPNAGKVGNTPISVAKNQGIRRILQNFLKKKTQ